MSSESVKQICDWKTVEQRTRKGTMADLVISSVRKYMWTEGKGLLQGVFLSFGGGSIVFDSPMPGILRLNTYCRDEETQSGIGGQEHVKPVFSMDKMDDAVWTLLADAFEDLCDEDQFCTEEKLMESLSAGTLEDLVLPAFSKYSKESVFLKVWFGERVSACWLGEGVIFMSQEDDNDGPCDEGKVSDSPEELAKAMAMVIRETYME